MFGLAIMNKSLSKKNRNRKRSHADMNDENNSAKRQNTRSKLSPSTLNKDAMVKNIKKALRKKRSENNLLTMNDTNTASSTSWEMKYPEETLNDVGGIEHLKHNILNDILLSITKPHLFQAFHVQPPRSILLSGPPGMFELFLIPF